MAQHKELSNAAVRILQQGGAFVPSPLALNANFELWEPYQRLLSLYYIRAGAKAVIPGAHTGEFALNDLGIYEQWLKLVKEMTTQYGQNMLLMAAIGGEHALKQAAIAAQLDYDIVMIAPTAFAGKSPAQVITVFSEIAAIIPTFAFELQRAIPGSYHFTPDLWGKILEISYGAKGASFDTYRSIVMLEAAAKSAKKESLTILTGNDDRIVADLLGGYSFYKASEKRQIRYNGGLLGHFATDTHAVVRWVNAILKARVEEDWNFSLSMDELSHAVNHCNMALFDALGNFENSVWGVKYRLTKLGLLAAPYCYAEKGRPGQAEAIDRIYGAYPALCDELFLEENLQDMKKEVGLI